MHEVGLDIKSLYQAPNPLPPQSHTLDSPGPNEIRGFTLRRVPVAVFSGLTLPFRWLWGKTKRLRLQKPPKVLFSFEQERFKYEGEPVEELQDALSPVYDQLDLHWYWRVMEWIPCELLPPDSCASVTMSSYGASRDYEKAERRDSRFGRLLGV